jgi:hypothetical protein
LLFSNGSFPPLSPAYIQLSTKSIETTTKTALLESIELPLLHLQENGLVNNTQLPQQEPTTINPNKRKVVQSSTTTTLPRLPQSKKHTVRIYNGITFIDQRNDLPSNDTIGLYEWQLKAQHQPLHKQMQQARKVLTTRDWQLARDELKSIKSIQKIEELKKKKMWCLYQLKKHRPVPRTKTHWDCMLEEMQWMRTDFKQERKWKMAVAHQIARDVIEWHLADDKATVCVKVRPPNYLSLEEVNVKENSSWNDVETATVEEGNSGLKLVLVEEDTSAAEAAVENTCTVEGQYSSLEAVEEEPRSKLAASEDNTLGMNGNAVEESAMAPEVDSKMAEELTTCKKGVALAADKELWGLSVTEQLAEVNKHMANGIKSDLLANAIKEQSMDQEEDQEEEDQDEEDDEEEEEHTNPPISPQVITEYRTLIQQAKPDQTIIPFLQEDHYDHVNSLFPDLMTYTAPDPDTMGNDPYFDEADYSRITPFRLSTRRIQLTGTKRKNQHEPEYLSEPTRYEKASPLFAPKRVKDLPAVQPPTPKQPVASSSQHSPPWSDEDDLTLIQIITLYSFNWELIADHFNQMRQPMTGEKRSPWECHQRWKSNNLTNLTGQVNTGKSVARRNIKLVKTNQFFYNYSLCK